MKANGFLGLSVVPAFVSLGPHGRRRCAVLKTITVRGSPISHSSELHINVYTYLGLGTRSSGTGVHVESGDFCSLNLPVKTWAMSSIS